MDDIKINEQNLKEFDYSCMTGLNPVGYWTLGYWTFQYWQGVTVSTRPQNVFYHREMVRYLMLKIGSRECLPFGSYSNSNARHFYNFIHNHYLCIIFV